MNENFQWKVFEKTNYFFWYKKVGKRITGFNRKSHNDSVLRRIKDEEKNAFIQQFIKQRKKIIKKLFIVSGKSF